MSAALKLAMLEKERLNMSHAPRGWGNLTLIGVIIGVANWKPDMSHPRRGWPRSPRGGRP
jgi:hypothetical protein